MRLQCVEHQCNGWDVVCAPWSHGFATGHNLTVKSGLGWWHVLSLTIFISTRHNRDLNLNWDSREDNILWQNLFWCWVINFHTTLTHLKHHWSELGMIIPGRCWFGTFQSSKLLNVPVTRFGMVYVYERTTSDPVSTAYQRWKVLQNMIFN